MILGRLPLPNRLPLYNYVSAFARCLRVFLRLDRRLDCAQSEGSRVSAGGITPWLLPLTFLSIGYVPKEGFPEWLQGFVAINPVSSAAQALRGLAAGGPVAGFVAATLLWSAALTVVFGTLATRAYQRRSS